MNGTILVADDSMVVRAVLRRQLETDGHPGVEAVNGAEAIDACREYRPDVILLDVEMPVLDGHATLERLKADPELKDIPVVFLTGRVDTADVVTGLHLGAHDYLRQPFEANELMARGSAALPPKWLPGELRTRHRRAGSRGAHRHAHHHLHPPPSRRAPALRDQRSPPPRPHHRGADRGHRSFQECQRRARTPRRGRRAPRG